MVHCGDEGFVCSLSWSASVGQWDLDHRPVANRDEVRFDADLASRIVEAIGTNYSESWRFCQREPRLTRDMGAQDFKLGWGEGCSVKYRHIP
jgi:hypothetical protein